MKLRKGLRKATTTGDDEEEIALKKRLNKKRPAFSDAIKAKSAMEITIKTQLLEDPEFNEMIETIQANQKGSKPIQAQEGRGGSSKIVSQVAAPKSHPNPRAMNIGSPRKAQEEEDEDIVNLPTN